MIILPDRKLSRGKLLMPVPKREWAFSLSLPRDEMGNETTRVVFRLRARTHDGKVVWRGTFADRDDADAFLFALISGSLRYERPLWRMPNPEWHPGVSTDLVYEFATNVFLTTTGGATYTSPSDWNNSSNTVEGIGGGGGGGARTQTITNGRAAGAGGGEYRKIANFTFATPGTTTASYTVGAGGTAVTAVGTSANTAGNAGADTTFDTTTLVAKAGAGGLTNTSNVAVRAGGSGGTGAAGNANGGSSGSTTSGGASSGAGGAGGPNGAGGNGVNATAVATNGGAGDNGSGGAAGTTPGGNGGNGTEFQVSPAYGSGGGGAGITTSDTNATAGSGGNYGAGGASALIRSTTVSRTATSGAGAQGLIVITYTPAASGISLANINLAMMGM